MGRNNNKNFVTLNASSLTDLLNDKGTASYQNSPDFAEIVEFINLFGKAFKITELSFAELEEALDSEEDNSKKPNNEWIRNEVLQKLYKEVLMRLGKVKDKAEESINKLLWKKYKQLKPYNDDSLMGLFNEYDEFTDMCTLSSAQKLHVINTLLNGILLQEGNHQLLDEVFSINELRLKPIVDSSGHKFWYFCDTYLFLEFNDNKKLEIKTKKLLKEYEEATKELFTADKLIIVCKTSIDWRKLINFYKENKEEEVANALSKYETVVSTLETKRLRALYQPIYLFGSRTSSRIQQKAEEKKREMEERKKLEMAKIKREEEERKRLGLPAKPIIDEQFNVDNKSMTREERALLREKKKYEQLVSSAITESTKEMNTFNNEASEKPDSTSSLRTNETNKIDDPAPISNKRNYRKINNDVIKVRVDDLVYESNQAGTSNSPHPTPKSNQAGTSNSPHPTPKFNQAGTSNSLHHPPSSKSRHLDRNFTSKFVPQINFHNNHEVIISNNEDSNGQYYIPIKKNSILINKNNTKSISQFSDALRNPNNSPFNRNSSNPQTFYRQPIHVGGSTQIDSRQHLSSNLTTNHNLIPSNSSSYYNNIISDKNVRNEASIKNHGHPENQRYQHHRTTQQGIYHDPYSPQEDYIISEPQTYYYEKNVTFYPITDHNMIYSDYNLAEEVIIEND